MGEIWRGTAVDLTTPLPAAAQLTRVVKSAADQIRRNIETLATIRDQPGTVVAAADLLDAADSLARRGDDDSEAGPGTRRLLTALHALRQMDRAIVTEAIDLGAVDGARVTSKTSTTENWL